MSVGNDIVALQSIDVNRTNHPAFYLKFITENEFALFAEAKSKLSFGQFVWLLWSVKESIYKAAVRRNETLIFSPLKINIHSITVAEKFSFQLDDAMQQQWIFSDDEENCITCVAYFQAEKYQSKSFLNDAVICTIAVHSSQPFTNIIAGIQQINTTDSAAQSAAVRILAQQSLQQKLSFNNIQFKQSQQGFPIVVINNKPTEIPLSFSHHQQYVGYAFAINFIIQP
jgi:phosphopantetheinyl transferase (holo-ACP synthase)